MRNLWYITVLSLCQLLTLVRQRSYDDGQFQARSQLQFLWERGNWFFWEGQFWQSTFEGARYYPYRKIIAVKIGFVRFLGVKKNWEQVPGGYVHGQFYYVAARKPVFIALRV